MTMEKGMPVRVNGPYISPSGKSKGRRYMNVVYADGSKGTTLYSRYLMEKRLGRRLDPKLETVDHINGDKTDDREENLQIMTQGDNARKSIPPAPTAEFRCPTCLVMFVKQLRQIRNNQGKKGKSGPYCSKSCAGRDTRRLQIINASR